MKKESIFIVGVHRSGTTALTRLLGLSSEAVVLSEPSPNLNAESRLKWDGWLSNPKTPLIRDILPRIARAHQAADVYIEKQNSLVPFLSDLHELISCKFIVMNRHGLSTVRSLMNWHQNVFPMFYCEAGGETLDPTLHGDFDLSLPRPRPGEEYHESWNELSRLEMMSWYWNRASLELENQVRKIPDEAVMTVELSELTAEKVEAIYRFAGLSDFDVEQVNEVLSRKVNSVAERVNSDAAEEVEWGNAEDSTFARFAGGAMRSLGYWDKEKELPYSECDSVSVDLQEKEAQGVPAFSNWFHSLFESGEKPSVLALGNKREFSERALDGESGGSEQSSYDLKVQEGRVESVAEKFDLVFSHSTIDNVHDPEIFLRNACRMSGKFLYLSSYRGWFPKFRQHQISWDAENRVYFNDISPTEIARVLREEGFENFVIFPQKSFRDDIAAETIIIASRIPFSKEKLAACHEPHQKFAPYQVENDEEKSAREVLEAVNKSCHYFSTSEGGYVADSLVDFDQLAQSLAAIDSRKTGTVEELICEESETNLAVRVDVDMDLMAAADMANLASIREIPLSFYLLHTAAYYGVRDGNIFRRFSRNAKIYNLLQECGHEVGLHTDALTIYRDWGIDGAAAVRSEIEWLRSEGLRISGTAAHNCAPVYGAENFEIFENRVIGDRAYTVSNWSCLPLGVLNEEELGLKYEANASSPSDRVGSEAQEKYLSGLPCQDFNRNASWMRTYLLENPHNQWGSDFSIWHLGGGFWVISGRDDKGEKIFRFGVSQEEVTRFVKDLKPELKVVFVLHPAYFGRREEWGSDPLYSAARTRIPFIPLPKRSLRYRAGAKILEKGAKIIAEENEKLDES